ncbi:hypothetical protein NEOLEDRAFT_1132864 [Neolentinus lepideus HHB14362 ss-1]|uniref:Uncharacterized protein n=1 Tax=Neolentinus lepideus HHB14362 ss-1 TaxID=1314782 RepID=A0A165SYP1_9AGAM|nr:hypothetical protein NEOLEDRAFT_1132864 [Neolentinus lepideus HHB14362 ss-1]
MRITPLSQALSRQSSVRPRLARIFTTCLDIPATPYSEFNDTSYSSVHTNITANALVSCNQLVRVEAGAVLPLTLFPDVGCVSCIFLCLLCVKNNVGRARAHR